MARVTDQDIPSEYLDEYKAVLGTSEWLPDDFRVAKRVPFRIPIYQGCRGIRPPIPRGPMVSDAMCGHRGVFCDAVKCFIRQPWAGGKEPDGLGGYSRTWWYNEAIGKLPWYYNYFMWKTLDELVAGKFPLWCKQLCLFNAQQKAPFGPTALCNYSGCKIAKLPTADWQSWIASPIENPRYIHVVWYNVPPAALPYMPFTVKIWKVPETWQCTTVPEGDNARNHICIGTDTYEYLEYGWRDYPVYGAKRVAFTMETENGEIQFRGKISWGGKYGPAFT